MRCVAALCRVNILLTHWANRMRWKRVEHENNQSPGRGLRVEQEGVEEEGVDVGSCSWSKMYLSIWHGAVLWPGQVKLGELSRSSGLKQSKANYVHEKKVKKLSSFGRYSCSSICLSCRVVSIVCTSLDMSVCLEAVVCTSLLPCACKLCRRVSRSSTFS